jgi:anti-sigma B factor antagonist
MQGGNEVDSAAPSQPAGFSAELVPLDDGTAVVIVRGDLDRVTSDQLKLHLRAGFDGGAKYVCIDLLDVHYMDSSGFGPMIEAYHRVQALGGAITVVCRDIVCELFDATGLAELFALRHRREDGLAYLSSRR